MDSERKPWRDKGVWGGLRGHRRMCVGGWERNVDTSLRRRTAWQTFRALLSSTQSPDRTRPQVGTVNGSHHFISLPPLLCWPPHPVLPCLAHGWTTPDLGISWGSVHPLLPQGYLYLLFTAPFSQLTLHQPRPILSSRESTLLLLFPSTAKGSHATVHCKLPMSETMPCAW